jgi:hypothetical protein
MVAASASEDNTKRIQMYSNKIRLDYATDCEAYVVKIRDVSPRIPEPKDPPRPHVVTLRLSDGEKEKLERACELFARHWKRDRAGHAELLRAGLEMILNELEATTQQG